jgi:electron transport protein HydN
MPNQIRILVVEHEMEICRDCGEMLSARGWEVETVTNGKDGLARARAESFDLVVLDLDLPDLTGLDLLRQVREAAPETPVVALTRHPSMSTAVEAMRAGAFDCLAKPCPPQAMASAADRALRARTSAAPGGVRKAAAGTGPATGLVIRVDPDLCEACLACTVACAYLKLALPEETPLRPAILFASRLVVAPADDVSVPVLCLQCAEAPCMVVCPTGALARSEPEGPISALVARCIGCASCVLACPVGVLTLSPDHRVVQKCDLCVSQTAHGHLPACVESCPTDALTLVHIDALTDAAAQGCARETVSQSGPKEGR